MSKISVFALFPSFLFAVKPSNITDGRSSIMKKKKIQKKNFQK